MATHIRLDDAVEQYDEWRSLPLANGVESLNVAVAGLVAYEVARRR